MVMARRVIFFADLHGNVDHLERLCAFAARGWHNATCLLIGGDLAPRAANGNTEKPPNVDPSKANMGFLDESLVDLQRDFLTNELVPRLDQLPIPSVCMPGNTDFFAALEAGREAARKVKILDGNAEVVGEAGEQCSIPESLWLAHVPLCHHAKKDFEIFDTRLTKDTLARMPNLRCGVQ